MFLLDDVDVDQWTTWICTSRRARVLDIQTLQEFINEDIHLFYSYTYGEKYDPHSLSISQNFKGSVFWNGFNGVELEGDYGNDFYQVASKETNTGPSILLLVTYTVELKSSSVKIQRFCKLDKDPDWNCSIFN